MSQSRSPSDTEQHHSPPTILLKEAANGTPVPDDQCPNLDDEVSAARGVDLAIPQKREREASLEPPTPHPDDTANEPASQNNRSQSPVKKSRALSTPTEADENDNEYDFVDALDGEVPVPSPRPSPPQEIKVSQQSQDTDDIDARNGQQSAQDHGDAAATPAVPDSVTPSDAQAQTGIPSPIHVATNTESQNQLEIVKVSATGEVDAKAPTGETNVPASVEPAATSPVTEEANLPVAASTKHISPSEAQRPPEIDNQNQPNSHADTGTGAGSNTREAKRPTPPLSEVDGATKRPREDEDGDLDPNPREAKRASPPPEKEKEKEKKEKPTRKKSGSDARAPSAPASPRSKPVSVFGGGGFASYASMESPFASLKGSSLFSSSTTLTKSSTITITNTTPTPPTTSNAAPPLTISSSLPNSPPKTVPNSPVQRTASPTPAKRTGFEAFASAASPFVSAAARTRSPVRRSGSPGPGAGSRSNPFAIYAAGGSQSLFSATGAPAAKRARGDSESIAPGECSESGSWREGSVGDEKSFGERLRAGSGSGGDDEDEADGGVWGEQTTGGKWAEQEVLTGEEEDETIHSVRGKLYILSEQNQWKERGSGLLRLNRRRVDRGGARLVMRKDAVFVVLLNVTLFRGMSCAIAQDPRYLRFSVLAPDGTIHYNLRVGSAQAAVDLLKAINDNIPRT